jgi:hypothetical protein
MKRGGAPGSDSATRVGMGGNQILLEDPSGNPVELFEPTRRDAALSSR